jgi:hypothetical protein
MACSVSEDSNESAHHTIDGLSWYAGLYIMIFVLAVSLSHMTKSSWLPAQIRVSWAIWITYVFLSVRIKHSGLILYRLQGVLNCFPADYRGLQCELPYMSAGSKRRLQVLGGNYKNRLRTQKQS